MSSSSTRPAVARFRCFECGEPLFAQGRSCPHCGATNSIHPIEEQQTAVEADAVAETHDAPGAGGAGIDAAGEEVRAAADPASASVPDAVDAEAVSADAVGADAPAAAPDVTDADGPDVIAARDGLAADRVAADAGGEAPEAAPAATAAASAAADGPDPEDGRIEPAFDVSVSESGSESVAVAPELAKPEPAESEPEAAVAGEPAGEAAFSPAVPQPKSDLAPKFAPGAPAETKPSFDAALEDVKPGADIAADKAEGDAAASGDETAAEAPAMSAPAFTPQASQAGGAPSGAATDAGSGAALGAAAGAAFSAGARPVEAEPADRGQARPGWLKSLWPGPPGDRSHARSKPSKAKAKAKASARPAPPPLPPRQETPAQFVRTARRTRLIQLAVVTCLVVLAAVYGRSWLKTAGFLTSGIEVQASTNWTNLPVDPAVFSGGPAIISANGPFRLRVDGTVYTIVGREQVVVPIGDATTVEVRSIERPLTVRFLPGQG